MSDKHPAAARYDPASPPYDPTDTEGSVDNPGNVSRDDEDEGEVEKEPQPGPSSASKKAGRRKTSIVWSHFEVCPEDPKYAICMFCSTKVCKFLNI